ncbi:MAG: Rid family detoxifying hydrolase [Ilumatobacteraceae bacterium]
MSRDTVRSDAAPAAIGPYSQAVRTPGGLLFLAGQTPIDPATGRLIDGDVGEQTRRCFTNLRGARCGGAGPEHVQKVNVYLTDMTDFAAINEAYAEQFAAPFPARTTVAVAALPLGARGDRARRTRSGGHALIR